MRANKQQHRDFAWFTKTAVRDWAASASANNLEHFAHKWQEVMKRQDP